MCGIVGFIKNIKDEELIKSFTNSIAHRGPDSIDYTIVKVGKSYLHLGSARLSIRGDSKENMPMKNTEENIIIYNGEIFDIKSLENYLNSNKKYYGDTRVLLDLLSRDEKSINKVNGMFAFAFYKKSAQKLLLGRDKLGIKPLYFHQNSQGDVYFSSEMSNLVEFANIHPTVESEALKKLFLFNGNIQNANLINSIISVEPGELISFDIVKNNKKTVEARDSINNLNHNLENINFEEMMESVIFDHLIADTSVDLFLSGGIDSTLLAYLSKVKLDKDLRHFSLSFENKSYNEEKLISKISNELNLVSTIFEFDNKKVSYYVSDSINNMNTLVLDYSYVPTYLLSKKTSKYTKAVISGDGADEIFGGYEWYRAIKYYNFLPPSILKVLKIIISKLNLTSSNGNYLDFQAKLQYFFKYITVDPYVQMIIWQSVFQKFDESKLTIISSEISNHISKDIKLKDNLRNIDINFFLYSNVLPKIDTASMRNSLEVRPPFLDERVLQFAFNTDESNKVGFFNTKKYLRNYMKDTNLKFINSVKKHGFGFPLQNWLLQSGLEEIREMHKDGKLIYLDEDKEYITNLIYNSNLNNNVTRELWAYYVTSKWFNKHKIRII